MELSERLLSESSVEVVRAPKSVKRICQRAFFGCKRLKKVEFEEGSELRSIEESPCCFRRMSKGSTRARSFTARS